MISDKKRTKKFKSKPSVAFMLSMVLVASLFVVAFSGSVDAEITCEDGECCTDAPVASANNCLDCDDLSVSTESGCASSGYVFWGHKETCEACFNYASYGLGGGGNSRIANFTESDCAEFSNQIKPNFDGMGEIEKKDAGVSGIANFQEFKEKGRVSPGESFSVSESGSPMEGVNVMKFEDGDMVMEGENGRMQVDSGDVFKGGPSGNGLVKVQEVNGQEKSAKMKNLGSRCDGKLKVLNPGDEIQMKSVATRDYTDYKGSEVKKGSILDSTSYTLDQGFYPDTPYGRNQAKQGNKDAVNQITFSELGYNTRAKVGSSFGGMTIMDIGANEDGELRVVVCVCDYEELPYSVDTSVQASKMSELAVGGEFQFGSQGSESRARGNNSNEPGSNSAGRAVGPGEKDKSGGVDPNEPTGPQDEESEDRGLFERISGLFTANN